MNLEMHLSELTAPDALAFRALADRLRAAPERTPSAGLADRILAAVDEERAHGRGGSGQRPRFPQWRAAAAAVAAGLAAAVTLFYYAGDRFRAEDQAVAPATGIGWLAANQEADGTWDPVRHGGAATYRPALTALSALALTHAQKDYAEQIDRACQALAALQTPDGAFGGQGRSQYYNQAITTFALASLYPQRPELKTVLERAIGFIQARQTVEGGWDYEANSEGNAAITAWQVRALACAAEQGFNRADVPMRKGLRWLRGLTSDEGNVAYHRNSATRSDSLNALAAYALITAGKDFPGLPSLGQRMAHALPAEADAQAATDCYRDYAKVIAFEAAGARQQADLVRGDMRKRQATGVRDQWDRVGGRLYTTALTALASRR